MSAYRHVAFMFIYLCLLLGQKLMCYVTGNICYEDNLFQGTLIPEAASICKKCIAPKPPRTHHCSVCNKCILKMDHHCRILIMLMCMSLCNVATFWWWYVVFRIIHFMHFVHGFVLNIIKHYISGRRVAPVPRLKNRVKTQFGPNRHGDCHQDN